MNVPVSRRILTVPAVASVLVCGCSSADWPAFRHDTRRTAAQSVRSPLSDPNEVARLKCMWRFPRDGYVGPKVEGFRASPIVYEGRVFIGNGNGYFYALDADSGEERWRFPPYGRLPLLSRFTCNPSSLGVAASATIARIGRKNAVIFAAPDPSFGNYLGDGRLFALEAESGEVIWESEPIARLTGITPGCTSEFHENLGHSSPLVFENKVYVGVGDHCDNPVQKGRVVAVHLANGRIVKRFSYCSTKKTDRPGASCDDPLDETRGGGVSSPPAGWRDSVFITTGNTRSGHKDEPKTNHGLSLLRLDATTGNIDWKFQPVPWELDGDPDWSATPTIMSTRCGWVAISTQKDGWTHAINASNGKRLWSFPHQEDLPFRCGTVHGDWKYMRSGAAWRDVYVTMNGSLNLPSSNRSGYRRLHAFNVCEPDPKKRLRWLVDVPGTAGCSGSADPELCLGNPTVTGGIVYIGTEQGVLVAIADPDIVATDRQRCAHPSVELEHCEEFGLSLVAQPRILREIELEGSMVYTEPALAHGRIYVSTAVPAAGGLPARGYVYMLRPSDKEGRCLP